MDKLKLFTLEGKKAIVTGGHQGMGRATAKYLALYGAEVCIIDIDTNLHATADTLSKETGGVFHAVVGDLSKSESRCDVFARAVQSLGNKLDILVNCAGIQYFCDAIDFPFDAYRKVMDINLDAVFELCQLAARIMIPQESGKIINFASMYSFVAGMQVPAYVASKGGVMQLTKALADEWGSKGIHINAVAPGFIDTRMSTEFFADKEASDPLFRRISIGRWGQPEDVAAVVLFLASQASDYIHGVTIPVDGGFLAMA